MSKHTITANHQAFGTVEFTLEARDAKDAFAKFKQIVFSAKQWIVTGNETQGCNNRTEPKQNRTEDEDLPTLTPEQEKALLADIGS